MSEANNIKPYGVSDDSNYQYTYLFTLIPSVTKTYGYDYLDCCPRWQAQFWLALYIQNNFMLIKRAVQIPQPFYFAVFRSFA